MEENNIEEISSRQYAEKILDVAYYNFPLVYPKSTVLKVVEALIDEYAKRSKI